MPISDALVVGEDWISEHYFTTDATKESFQGRVIERRKTWDAEAAEAHATTRSRFLAARGDLEKRLVAVSEPLATDPAEESEGAVAARRPLTSEQRAAVDELYDVLLDVLGYRTGEFALTSHGPITWVAPPSMPQNPPLAIVRASPQATVDDLIAKKVPTLLAPWERDGQDPVTSVSATLSELMTDADGPAFALVLAGRWCLIAEKERWPEGRWLAVDLQLVCERNDTKRGGEIDRALVCLDGASLAPDASGTTWWRETLEDSVKHTVGVSKDLQEGVRQSIEILANEVVRRRAPQGLEPLPADQAQPLAKQCLRYLYRILFLLYAEASPELGVLPVGAQEYDAGYGLDRLRDLALTEIHSERSRHGSHLYESLDRLFVLVDRGHAPAGDESLPEGLEFHGLRADLFRPEATAHLDATKLGNEALLQVLRKLLLSKESGKQQRGFISYVELGINQLGAVYEGLMSYTGSFATEDLYEVAKNGDPSKGSWVVPVHRSDHLDPADFVRVRNEETGEDVPVLHRKGTFVFRLSGRDRQRSASYYTPEVLTRFTVQQALEELLDQDGTRTSAEEILQLTVCEPALGSGAFAIEAVRQLAEQYLSRREEELGVKVDPDDRPREVQKVKAHIALHQVYGVDLNATAVELAEVSLWLDTMVAGLQAPWFGLRLKRGNSLVGARRALYDAHQVRDRSWLTTPPQDEPLTSLAALIENPDGGGASTLATRVHHFLLPAQGWGSAVEVPKVVRDLVPDSRLKALKAWRSGVRKKPSNPQIKRLQALAERVETLWGLALRRLRMAEAESSRAIGVWGRETLVESRAVSREEIEASLADPNGAYRRLRLVMDAWCALWYWPLTELEMWPPTVDQWLDACEAILGKPDSNRTRARQPSLARTANWDELGQAEEMDLGFAGAQRIERIREEHAWLAVCDKVADEQGFFHWELDFATVFARGGFDLQVGNPPWVRPDVNVDELLAEGDPWWALALKPSEAAKDERRRDTLTAPGMYRALLDGTTETVVLAGVLTDSALYPLITTRPDLYRAFMTRVWANARRSGVSGLIHYETHFTDDKAQPLRRATYQHLRRHWQFINELQLFEIQHQKRFGVNVYGVGRVVDFLHATSLYHPETVTRSEVHDGSGIEPGFKDLDGVWDLRPHLGRIQRIDERSLRVWADIMEAPTASETPMVYMVNSAATRVLATMSEAQRLASRRLNFSAGWNEKTDKERGRFVGGWGPASWEDAILQGSHVYVSRPLYKTPNTTMRHHLDWTETDLEGLTADALPVTAYKPAGDRPSYDAAYTHWGEQRDPARNHYRVAWRAMAANTGERTLISAIIPPGAAHVHTVNTLGILPADSPGSEIRISRFGLLPIGRLLAVVGALTSSLLADFMVRSAPKSAITPTVVGNLPLVPLDHPLIHCLVLRTLRLNCVTEHYLDLWAECWDDAFLDDSSILPRFDERPIGPEWTADTPLRRAVDRRNAQVEVDALVALMLGVPVEDLSTIYRTQFAVLYGYDHHEYNYDVNGRLVPHSVLSLWRKLGKPCDDSAMSAVDRTAVHPGSDTPYTYEFPFRLYDREEDFRTAYAEWERRMQLAEAPPVGAAKTARDVMVEER